MTRRDFRIPLLIGGATTSKQHTAVRIAPAYDGTTVHVLDASRVIGVVSDLLDDGRRGKFEQDNHALQEKLRAQHSSARRPLLRLSDARAKRMRVPFDDLSKPPFTPSRRCRLLTVNAAHTSSSAAMVTVASRGRAHGAPGGSSRSAV